MLVFSPVAQPIVGIWASFLFWLLAFETEVGYCHFLPGIMPGRKLEFVTVGFMYKKILLALDESKEAKGALQSAIQLAQQLGAEMRIVTVGEPLPVYAAFMDAEIPGARQKLLEERNDFYSALQKRAIEAARKAGVRAEGVVIEGDEVHAIVDDLVAWGADLLVIGRRHHSTMSRLWGGTVHNIAEKARCSILAVY